MNKDLGHIYGIVADSNGLNPRVEKVEIKSKSDKMVAVKYGVAWLGYTRHFVPNHKWLCYTEEAAWDRYIEQQRRNIQESQRQIQVSETRLRAALAARPAS